MNRNEAIPVVVTSAILLLYAVLVVSGSSSPFVHLLFFISPFLMIWMVYNVIRFGEYKGRDLEKDEEWGMGIGKRSEHDSDCQPVNQF